MDKMTCTTQRKNNSYEILIDSGISQKAASFIHSFCHGKKIVVVSDSNVAPLYADKIVESIKEKGFDTYLYTFKAGESSKNISTITEMYSFLCQCDITRSDMLVALGGGVTGDMTGFVAATYQRGIDFIQMPTTLLSDVDASVGGKTGYDLPKGKNLVGAFYQPRAVFIDTDFLSTLPSDIYADGMAEVIKTALLFDREFAQTLLDSHIDDENIIARCVHYKISVVGSDENDTGIRGLLNFGHTFGHAIEKLGGYKTISHGSAVAIGMVIAARIGIKLGITQKNTDQTIIDLLKKYNLPFSTDYSADEIFNALTNDKKRSNDFITIILLSEAGNGILHKISLDDLKNAMQGAV